MTATAQLLARLERHYIKPGESFPGGVFLPEVGWNGGLSQSRADALYVGFTGSSGRLLIGHELKVSRADWRKELDTPGKADAWADQCHAWYVVAPSTAIVPAAEVPDGWGLLIPSNRSAVRMDVVVTAKVHSTRQPSWEALRSVLARADTLRVSAIASAVHDAREKAQAQVDERVELALQQHAVRDPDSRTRANLEALCQALDLQPDHLYDREIQTIAEAAAFLRAYDDVYQAARALTGRYLGATEQIRRSCDELDRALGQVTAMQAGAA